mmetsp:Transcript_8889/g.13656  ORF Transcript_8889/g.13656 Transcript_8889/m.13656 type:complete len:492 (-) Transcript_8889:1294-2769(-)
MKRHLRRHDNQLSLQRLVFSVIILCFALFIWRITMHNNDARRIVQYEKFWNSTLAETAFWRAEELQLVASFEPACPKVFVYKLSSSLTDFWTNGVNRSSQNHNEQIFVPETALDENGNLLEVILDRLSRSKRCSTLDPSEASLFLVPILPKSKHWSAWSQKCREIFDGVGGIRSLRLSHLTQANARRHFFIFPRVGYMPKCAGWWATPIADERLIQFARIAVGGYEEFSGDFQRAKTLAKLSAKQRKRPQMLVPRLISAPYVANVRFIGSSNFLFSPSLSLKKTYLYHYAGTPHGSPKATRLRALLQKICYSEPKFCASSSGQRHPPDARDAENGEWSHTARLDSTLSMRNATFCLEPPGLTPGRSSIVTALLLGCIPVFFAKEQDSLWPLHLGSWLDNARLFIHADHLLNAQNPTLFLRKALLSVPPARIAAMQKAIHAHAYRLQYSMNDMPGDALEVLLRGIHAASFTNVTTTLVQPTKRIRNRIRRKN